MVTFNIKGKEGKGQKFKAHLESQWNPGNSYYSTNFA